MPYHVGKKGSYGCSGYPAVSTDGKVHGCHKTRAAAAGQIYAINRSEGNIDKAMIIVGDFVLFGEEEELKIGRVQLISETMIGLPSDEAVEPMPGDPAVLIRLYEKGDEYSEEKEELVIRNMSELTKIASLIVEVEQVAELQSSPDNSQADELAMAMVAEGFLTEIGKRAGGKMPSSIGQPTPASSGDSVIEDPKIKPKRSIGGTGTPAQKSDEEASDADLFAGFGKDFTRVERRSEVFLPKGN